MADNTGTAMSYSSMKGRLHDGLLKGLEAMGYEYGNSDYCLAARC